MSLTTNSQKTCSLDSINKSNTEATLYTAFYYPKTQSEAIKLIYGIEKSTISIFGEDHERAHKSTSNINTSPITNARKKLLNKNFIKKMDDNLKNSIFKASPIPITNYIKNKIKLRKSRRTPDPAEDYTALTIILDSKWFRSFFSNEFLLNPPTHTAVSDDIDETCSVYHPFGYFTRTRRIDNRIHYLKFEVYDVVNLFSYLIEDIGAYSWGIVPFLKQLHGFDPITSHEIIQIGNFDKVIENYQNSLPIEAIREYYSYCIEEDNSPEWAALYNPRRFIEKITIQSALIPSKISEDMTRAGRIPYTLLLGIRQLHHHLNLF